MNVALRRARGARLYERRAASGMCQRCGQVPSRPDRALCAECQAERAVKQEARREAKLLAGLCVVGACAETVDDGSRCARHAAAHRADNVRSYWAKKGKGR